MRRVAIIGAGASGLSAAIAARDANPNADITIYEQHSRVGVKLMKTGNGRCNIMNAGETRGAYARGDEFAERVFSIVPKNELDTFFQNIGLVLSEEEGRVYPASERAGSVVDVLRFQMEGRGVRVCLGEPICDVSRGGNVFLLNDKYEADKLIIATGGRAGIGARDATGYALIKRFGHAQTALRPALTRVLVSPQAIRGLKGVRLSCEISADTKSGAFVERGEIIFSDAHLSGIPIMNLTCLDLKSAQIHIDMLPNIDAQTLARIIDSARVYAPNQLDSLAGLVHPRIASIIISEAGGEASSFIIASRLKDWQINTTRDDSNFGVAQVTSGGINVGEFSPETMESKLISGLYATGETLDVHAKCGGFNLMFAFATGVIAGRAAAKDRQEGRYA